MSIVCWGSFAPRSSILDQSFDESAGLRQLCRQVFGQRRITILARSRQSKLDLRQCCVCCSCIASPLGKHRPRNRRMSPIGPF